MADFVDYYEKLMLPANASAADIHRRVRMFADRYRPDANKGDARAQARLATVLEASTVLENREDPKAKEKYDAARIAWLAQQAGRQSTHRDGYQVDPFNAGLSSSELCEKLAEHPTDPRLKALYDNMLSEGRDDIYWIRDFCAHNLSINAERPEARRACYGIFVRAINQYTPQACHNLEYVLEAMLMDGGTPEAEALFTTALPHMMSVGFEERVRDFYGRAHTNEAALAAVRIFEKYPDRVKCIEDEFIGALAYNPTHPLNVRMLDIFTQQSLGDRLLRFEFTSGWICKLEDAYNAGSSQSPENDIAIRGIVRGILKIYPRLAQTGGARVAKYLDAAPE